MYNISSAIPEESKVLQMLHAETCKYEWTSTPAIVVVNYSSAYWKPLNDYLSFPQKWKVWRSLLAAVNVSENNGIAGVL